MKIQYGEKVKKSIKAGIEKINNAVKVTLGPKGRFVAIKQGPFPPTITNDGVTIAKRVFLDDEFEDMGARALKEISIKTNTDAGDGTTTAIILGHAIYQEGLKYLNKVNPIKIKEGIDLAVNACVKELKAKATKIKGEKSLQDVAIISANNDASIGNIVAEAMNKVGENGMVTVDSSNRLETIIEMEDGAKIDKGFASPYFINQVDKAECILANPLVLVTDREIATEDKMLGVLKVAFENHRPLLIIAENISHAALSLLVINKMPPNNYPVVAIKAPYQGVRRKEALQDIAIMTGATLICEETGKGLSDITLAELGAVKKVIVREKDTTIIATESVKKDVEEQIVKLKDKLKLATSDNEKFHLKMRVAKLSESAAVIKVGGSTAMEVDEKKFRIDDALSATRAALEEGIVVGGGTSLYNLIPLLNKERQKYDKEVQVGFNVIMKALEAPLRQLTENSGVRFKDIITQLKLISEDDIGFNAKNGRVEDLNGAGVVDPVKVVRLTLQNAASITSLLLLTDVMLGAANTNG